MRLASTAAASVNVGQHAALEAACMITDRVLSHSITACGDSSFTVEDGDWVADQSIRQGTSSSRVRAGNHTVCQSMQLGKLPHTVTGLSCCEPWLVPKHVLLFLHQRCTGWGRPQANACAHSKATLHTTVLCLQRVRLCCVVVVTCCCRQSMPRSIAAGSLLHLAGRTECLHIACMLVD